MTSLFEVPLFSDDKVTPALRGSTGEAFQHFIGDLLLCEGLPVIEFPARGKDGAIDHIVEYETHRQVIECKDLTRFEDATRAWKNVAEVLQRNITQADGPLKGERQYQPWFDHQTKPIKEYWFCVSAQCSTTEKLDTLRNTLQETIRAFFISIGL